MALTSPVVATGVERKKEQEVLRQLVACVQGMLRQLATGAHDLSICVQKAAHLKNHAGAKVA
jgi:hypothetical protein